MPHGSYHRAHDRLPPGQLCLVPAPLQGGLLVPLLRGSHVVHSAVLSGYPIHSSQRARGAPGLFGMAVTMATPALGGLIPAKPQRSQSQRPSVVWCASLHSSAPRNMWKRGASPASQLGLTVLGLALTFALSGCQGGKGAGGASGPLSSAFSM